MERCQALSLFVSAGDFFLKPTILCCNGYFTGKRFATMFGVKAGDCFIDAKVLPLVQKNLKYTVGQQGRTPKGKHVGQVDAGAFKPTDFIRQVLVGNRAYDMKPFPETSAGNDDCVVSIETAASAGVSAN